MFFLINVRFGSIGDMVLMKKYFRLIILLTTKVRNLQQIANLEI